MKLLGWSGAQTTSLLPVRYRTTHHTLLFEAEKKKKAEQTKLNQNETGECRQHGHTVDDLALVESKPMFGHFEVPINF
jgi:hypothetical protein